MQHRTRTHHVHLLRIVPFAHCLHFVHPVPSQIPACRSAILYSDDLDTFHSPCETVQYLSLSDLFISLSVMWTGTSHMNKFQRAGYMNGSVAFTMFLSFDSCASGSLLETGGNTQQGHMLQCAYHSIICHDKIYK